ncbi:ABC transporter ATP-binding protein [Proteinivorax hydrogeniformans]|uniref:ABC transporter ATP-binding protein n=1 Tax=Proteinivorax hydrogeniformans TaxID=1826727 RepID=A0AAU8HWB8_9FIRM
MLKIRNASVSYMGLKEITEAVKDINLQVNEGEFISIVGPSGCGKSTLLSLIAGLIRPTEGSVKNTFNRNGYMFQQDFLLPWRNILDNAVLGLEIAQKKNKINKKYAEELLDSMGLSEFKNYYPAELSGGMRQRVALARTLALKPDLLLLDEPFSALDYQTRLNMQQEVGLMLRREKKTVILVTHDISEAIAMSDKVIILTKRPGRVIESIEINLNCASKAPMSCRSASNFGKYFNQIWGVLNNA